MELRRALAGGQIQAWAQPVVSLTDGRIHGVELLARWTLRDGTVVSPAVFVSLAEEVGLVRDLGRQMLVHAAALIQAWADHVELAR